MPESTIDPTALACAYAAARYTAVLDGREIPFTVGARALALEAAWTRECYGFLTAWNPASIARPAHENAAADARLRADLDAAGIACLPAWSADAAGRWREPGWLLGNAEDAALFALGRDARQAGVLHWRRGKLVRLAMLLAARGTRTRPAFTDWVE